jgi:superfamily II DNA or RNA helicase
VVLPVEVATDPSFKADTTYQDTKITYQIKQLKEYRKQGEQHWYIRKNGLDFLDEQIRQLEKQEFKSLIKRVGNDYTIAAGYLHKFINKYPGDVVKKFTYPEPKGVAWAHAPKHPVRPYQAEAARKLIEEKHASVSISTGLGKSRLAFEIIHTLGLKTVIVTPSVNIAEQFLREAEYLFGKGKVGQFYRGKKVSNKLITIAVSKSLTLVEENDEHYKNLVTSSVLCFDESHTAPAETLERVCNGLLSDVPYRFFFSGTQIRGDGLEIVLDGIIGPIVHTMDVREGVDGGYLTKPRFFSFDVKSYANFSSFDPIKLNRVHLHDNPAVYRHAAALIRASINKGRRVVVLIEEIPQFVEVRKHLKDIDIRFAHGGGTDHKSILEEQFHKSNPLKLVDQFDAGEFPVLVGTSVIGTGTDIKSVGIIIDIVGGKAETRIRQNVGRGTRLFEGKEDFLYIDYSVVNIPILKKQGDVRRKIFDDIYGPVDVKVVGPQFYGSSGTQENK